MDGWRDGWMERWMDGEIVEDEACGIDLGISGSWGRGGREGGGGSLEGDGLD